MINSIGLGVSIMSLTSVGCYSLKVGERILEARGSKQYKEDRKFRRYIKDVVNSTCKKVLWLPILFYTAIEFGLAGRDGSLFGSLLFSKDIVYKYDTILKILAIMVMIIISIKYITAYFDIARTPIDGSDTNE